MRDGRPGPMGSGELESVDHDAEETVLGVLEDDRFRATVTTTGDEVVVTLEGHLDESAVPVVDELLEAVGRWPGRADRRRSEASPEREGGAGPGVTSGATLLLDTRQIELDPASRQMLADHRDRWQLRHGPCASLLEESDQGSKR
jgi:hypothetical protein